MFLTALSGIVGMSADPSVPVISIMLPIPSRICHTDDPACVIISITPGVPLAITLQNASVAIIVLCGHSSNSVDITGNQISLRIICHFHLCTILKYYHLRKLSVIIAVPGDSSVRILSL